MRIVSQDKMFEIPYEDMCVEIGSRRNDATEILAYPVNGDGLYCWTLGVYDTKERALEVMEEIRGHYANTNVALRVGDKNDFNNACETEDWAQALAKVLSFFEMPKE